MNGITYFKLNSQYPGDVTKNCGLTGSEIDNNFYVLEGRDVKSVSFEDGAVKLTLLNGDVLYADISSLTEGVVTDLSFEFDQENGVLKIMQNGVVQEIAGFVTTSTDNNSVTTDNTLRGNGLMSSPLGISEAFLTGQYKPVKEIWALDGSGRMPADPKFGDRYLVKGSVSQYGRLYNYLGVKAIACDLAAAGNGWRVPTKEDWDDMLNAMEPIPDKRNHDNPSSNIYLGQYAGAYLKSDHGWLESAASGDNADTGAITSPCGVAASMCNPTYCGEYGTCRMRCHCNPPASDDYGFDAMPTGFIDENGVCGYFGQRAPFWTASMTNSCNSAYIKRVDWDRSSVYQDIVPTNMRFGVRLVKEYTGNNFFGAEEILDTLYTTVLMPSLKSGNKIWMAENFASLNSTYDGLEPCGAEGADKVARYFIAEWNGMRWVTSMFGEGDSVVVINDGDKHNTEYRRHGDELESVAENISTAVYELIQDDLHIIEDSIAELGERVDSLDNRVTTLENVVGDENEGLVKEVNDINDVLYDDSDGVLVRIDSLESTVEDIVGDVIDNGTFDEETGMLTLNRRSGQDPVNVQFGFNFGDI